mmetsp:Transcript_8580/g.25338  ORF Transcript_8580/g.25338 Transcript_8580/m.25338 type:complete len:206 (-) Transcript_8580:21-638(-)
MAHQLGEEVRRLIAPAEARHLLAQRLRRVLRRIRRRADLGEAERRLGCRRPAELMHDGAQHAVERWWRRRQLHGAAWVRRLRWSGRSGAAVGRRTCTAWRGRGTPQDRRVVVPPHAPSWPPQRRRSCRRSAALWVRAERRPSGAGRRRRWRGRGTAPSPRPSCGSGREPRPHPPAHRGCRAFARILGRARWRAAQHPSVARSAAA